MSSEQNHQHHHDQQSHCPQCNHKYHTSSQNEEQSQQKQRIIIPIRRDLLGAENNQTQLLLKNLQAEIQNLKNSNNQKDKMIEDLKKQIEHKMTHYMIFGEINKQADEINKLKTQINYTSNIKNSRNKQVNQDQIRSIFRQESRRFVDINNNSNNRQKNLQRPIVYRSQSRFKTHSTHDNYSALKKQLMSPKNEVKQKKRKINKEKINDQQQQSEMMKQYYETSNTKQIFKIGQSKRKIAELEQKIKVYEKQILWMSNFVCTFIKTMQTIGYKKYQEQIIIPEWTLKKKAKTSWRYMKHLFKFLYQDQK